MLQDILLIVIGLIVGAVIGFFVCRKNFSACSSLKN